MAMRLYWPKELHTTPGASARPGGGLAAGMLSPAHARQIHPDRQGRRGRGAEPATEKGRPRLPGRRLVLHFPRLSRAAAADPQVGRAAGQRGARLLQHAVEAFARHEAGGAADPSRGGVRQVGEHVPHRVLSRLQGAPARSARRLASRNSRSSARRCTPSTSRASSRAASRPTT